MTNEEAIKIIEIARAEIEWEYPMDYAAAFDKAIEALNMCRKIEEIFDSHDADFANYFVRGLFAK